MLPPTGEERALVAVLPTDAVVHTFAGTQDFEDLASTSCLPCPLRLEDHLISNPALYHRSTSLETSIAIKAYRRAGMDSIRGQRPPPRRTYGLRTGQSIGPLCSPISRRIKRAVKGRLGAAG